MCVCLCDKWKTCSAKIRIVALVWGLKTKKKKIIKINKTYVKVYVFFNILL